MHCEVDLRKWFLDIGSMAVRNSTPIVESHTNSIGRHVVAFLFGATIDKYSRGRNGKDRDVVQTGEVRQSTRCKEPRYGMATPDGAI